MPKTQATPKVDQKAAKVIARAAEKCARTHRGETSLEFHLARWAEESSSYTGHENRIMLEAARLLLDEGLF